MKIAVSVNDPPVWVIPDGQVARLRAVLADDEIVHAHARADRAAAFRDADVLLATSISADEFEQSRRLRWIHSTAVGVARLLPPVVVDSRVVVTNSRGVHSAAIAEHAIALVLALRRRLHVAVARQHARDWAQVELAASREPALTETTMMVVGLGTIGSRVAAMAAALGMRVIGVRKRPSLPPPAGVAEVLTVDQIADALPDVDVVVLAIPRTHDNRVLLGAPELAQLKPSAILVNVARGQLVDETALIDALRSGRLAGAGLDAFHQEPLPADHPLWALPNVLMTPHTAAFALEYWRPVVDLFLENVARFKRGEPLLNVVDKELGY
jgi:D-2-hydroxyacid dehydrogenase (NADP+)